jgi:hypothetical protein
MPLFPVFLLSLSFGCGPGDVLGSWFNSGIIAEGETPCGTYTSEISFNESFEFTSTNIHSNACSNYSWTSNYTSLGSWTTFQADGLDYLHLITTFSRNEYTDEDGDGEFEVDGNTEEFSLPYIVGSDHKGDYLIFGDGFDGNAAGNQIFYRK